MNEVTARTVLWEPANDGSTEIERFAAATPVGSGSDYEALWRWSVSELNDFWLAVWNWFEVEADLPDGPLVALEQEAMPATTWFPGVRLNYAETVLRLPGRAPDEVVVIARSETRPEIRLTAGALRDLVARTRAGLLRAGVKRGDVVAAYAPNTPETLAVMLAAASLGAVFASCPPEFGLRSVIDRLGQVKPRVLFAVDGYVYGGKAIERAAEVARMRDLLPSIETLVFIDQLHPGATLRESVRWVDFTAEPADLQFDRVPFDHPLYVLFSSGTTGLPKPIVHRHGGIVLEHLKSLALQTDLGPSDTFFWYSTTGWMMWNYLVSGLGVGATIVLFDGNPATPTLARLWQMAAELKLTYFGTSAPFLLECRKRGLVPREIANLSRIRGVGSTGAPLPPEGFHWVHDAVSQTAHLSSLAGGTDICSGFVGSSPTVPVYAGRISCRALGAAVAAYETNHAPVTDETGELVLERPMPSMPIGFWGDETGDRFRSAYFEDIPGVWRHGDWISISPDGTCDITGRSDATLNRGGVRLGTAEFYAVVDGIPEICDSLVVHLEADASGGNGSLILLVAIEANACLDGALEERIKSALRGELSPRHVPDVIARISAIPRTLSGKRIEVPVKRVLTGSRVSEVLSRESVTNPESIDEIQALRTKLLSAEGRLNTAWPDR